MIQSIACCNWHPVGPVEPQLELETRVTQPCVKVAQDGDVLVEPEGTADLQSGGWGPRLGILMHEVDTILS